MNNNTPLLSLGKEDKGSRGKFRFLKYVFVALIFTTALWVCAEGIQNPSTKGATEVPVSTCGCKKKAPEPPKDVMVHCSCGSGKQSGKRGQLNKWVKEGKTGHINDADKHDIKKGLRDGQKSENEATDRADAKKRTENGENDIKADDPRGFVVYKKKVDLNRGKKEKDDDSMTMVRRPKRMRAQDKDKKSGIDWEENHIKSRVKSKKDVKKVDGENGFHQSKLKSYSDNRARMKQNPSEKSVGKLKDYNFPNGEPDKLKPHSWDPIAVAN